MTAALETSGATRVARQDEARALAARINDGSRLRPVVVVSIAAGQPEPFVDVDEIAASLHGLADVVVLPTGDVSWAFSDAMPPMTQVYGGASRVYPVDLDWVTTPSRSPLRFAFGDSDRSRVTELIVSDAMAMAMAAGLMTAHHVPGERAVEGEVFGVAGGRAFVKTDAGLATIWPELTVPGVSAERLFGKGMRVSGLLDPVDKRLDVRADLRPLDDLLAAYAVGRLVLGRVTRVDAGGAHVELLPGCRVYVDARDVSAGTDLPLTSLISVDEVVTATVTRTGEAKGKGWKLTLTDVDGEQPSYAAALLHGGPPWLELVGPDDEPQPEAKPQPRQQPAAASGSAAPAGEPQTRIPSGDTVDAVDVTGSHVQLVSQLEAMRLERDGFSEELARATARVDRLDNDRRRLRQRLREASNRADRLEREAGRLREEGIASAGDGALFMDADEQLDFEVRLAWARRTLPGEKGDFPVRPYLLGENFLSSWAEVDIDRQKVVDVIVDIVTGRVHDVAGRETHQLRESEAGNAPFVRRGDGATCWRVALQVRTPQARRLHYWQLNDGSVELSSVRLHDDFRP